MKICLLMMAALCGMAVLTGSTKYEEKPMKMEYKKEEPKTPEYKTESKMEYGKKPETKTEYSKKPEYKTEAKMEMHKEEKKTDYPTTKMEYTTKKKMYKRSVDDDTKKEDEIKTEDDTKKEVTEDQIAEDPRILKEIKIIRRVLIKRIMTDPLIRYAFINYPDIFRRGKCWNSKDSKEEKPARSVDPDLTAEPDNIDEDMDEMHENPPGCGRPMRPPGRPIRPQVLPHPPQPVRPSWRRPMVCRRICY